MADMLQMTFLDVFLLKESLVFESIISSIGSGNVLLLNMRQVITWTNDDIDLWFPMTLPDHYKITPGWTKRLQKWYFLLQRDLHCPDSH